MSDTKDIMKALMEKGKEKGFEDCEVYYEETESTSVNIYNSKVEKTKNTSGCGLGFRGIYKGNMGYCYSEFVSPDVLDDIINNAMENALIINGEKEILYKGCKEYPHIDAYDPKIDSMTLEEKIKFCLDMEKAALEYDTRIKAVKTSQFSTGKSYVCIMNTKGLMAEDKSNIAYAYVDAVAEENGQIKQEGHMEAGKSLSNSSAEKIGQEAARKTIESLGAESLKSGKYNVIIENEAFADIMEHYVSNFYGENVMKGFSLLADKLDKKIASPVVDICDDGLLEDGFGTASFDGEGVASMNKIVVEKGILKTFLHNLRSAEAMGTAPTGNGSRLSFKSAVGTYVTNFYIKKGEFSLYELMEKVSDGIVITQVSGLHAGTNSISGDFSLLSQGFVIKNGKKDRPVEQITIAGNFYDVLKNIQAVGCDLKMFPSGIGSPSVFVGELSVSGE